MTSTPLQSWDAPLAHGVAVAMGATSGVRRDFSLAFVGLGADVAIASDREGGPPTDVRITEADELNADTRFVACDFTAIDTVKNPVVPVVLASDRTNYVTGISQVVDGGMVYSG